MSSAGCESVSDGKKGKAGPEGSLTPEDDEFPTVTKNRVLGAQPPLSPGDPASGPTRGHRLTPGSQETKQGGPWGAPSIPPEESETPGPSRGKGDPGPERGP